MPKVKRLGVLSVAVMQGLIMAVIGLIAGLMFAIMGTLSAAYSSLGSFGYWMILIAPVFYGCMGFVMGAAGAFLFNLFAGWVGGIEIEFAQ